MAPRSRRSARKTARWDGSKLLCRSQTSTGCSAASICLAQPERGHANSHEGRKGTWREAAQRQPAAGPRDDVRWPGRVKPMVYLLDANVLITAHHLYYPLDSVPEF